MYTRTKSVLSAALYIVLTLALAAGAAASGGYAAEGAFGQSRSSARGSMTQVSGGLSAQAEKYYEADRLPMFQFVVSKLSTADLQQWLTRTYNDRKVAFFSVVANALSYRAKLPESFARQAYEDQAVSYFSILADSMSDAQLETWLERALADGRISFCAMLYDKLDWKDELDQFQEELDRQLAAEYQKVGITLKGKSYYYKGQRVRTFLDIRANSAFYTLNTDPSGTVNVLVERSSNGSIRRVTCPTNAQIEQLLDA